MCQIILLVTFRKLTLSLSLDPQLWGQLAQLGDLARFQRCLNLDYNYIMTTFLEHSHSICAALGCVLATKGLDMEVKHLCGCCGIQS